jgi:DNA-binding response OmpR family regulator
LVLDDDPDSLNVLSWVLERNYTVVKTDTADHAIEICQNFKDQISLIVADVFLRSPVSGTRVAIDARVCCKDVPILLTSGTPVEGWRDCDFENFKKLMSGRLDFLLKPFTAQVLVRKVEVLLNGDWLATEAQTLYEDAEAYRRSLG